MEGQVNRAYEVPEEYKVGISYNGQGPTKSGERAPYASLNWNPWLALGSFIQGHETLVNRSMTKSEINAVMTGGFATIAGTVLGAFIAMGIDPGHLITCSFMAAPTALAVSKLSYPETEKSKTTFKDIKVEKGEESNVLDSAAKGASTAIMLVLNIAASLLAFIAFITFLNDAVNWFGVFAGWEELTFEYLLGYLFWPLAYLMGVPIEDCEAVGKLIGNKMLITEFPTFGMLGEMHASCEITERSYVITTYALCGFANFPSIGIQIGGFGAMAPERKSDIASLAFRAMIGGCLVSFLNACIAGSLVSVGECVPQIPQ